MPVYGFELEAQEQQSIIRCNIGVAQLAPWLQFGIEPSCTLLASNLPKGTNG